MSKMSSSYPVMQILGYQRIDELSNQLVNEDIPLSFYPGKARATGTIPRMVESNFANTPYGGSPTELSNR